MNEEKQKTKFSVLSLICLILLALIFGEATFLMVVRISQGSIIKNNNESEKEQSEQTTQTIDPKNPGGSEPTYTITWLNYDGTVLEVDQNVAKNAVPTYDGTTPTKAAEGLISYTFKSWNHEVVAATIDATYVATYTTSYNNATVVFDLGGHGTIDNVSVNYNGLIVKPTDPTTEGYTFVGWYKEPSYTIPWNFATDKVTSDVTIYAKWDVNYYTVTFDVANDNCTEVIPDQMIAYGGKVTKPADLEDIIYSEWANDEFKHWVDADGNEWNFDSDTVRGDLVLYAFWVYNR